MKYVRYNLYNYVCFVAIFIRVFFCYPVASLSSMMLPFLPLWIIASFYLFLLGDVVLVASSPFGGTFSQSLGNFSDDYEFFEPFLLFSTVSVVVDATVVEILLLLFFHWCCFIAVVPPAVAPLQLFLYCCCCSSVVVAISNAQIAATKIESSYSSHIKSKLKRRRRCSPTGNK